ncbi:aminopeptidase [Streptomyces mobaraensis NBRC 13819 = DSM 40847]|uniref:Aminopeptidase n=1 Tax=Streptomyces mobaraensis (strain ATCC 29032 / DSM 40847 / JCM 4168 / NBRC 13819 / NCIMB 11159 / IPCR 16-22) TaxID=1223523 RepID=M3CBT3_STRM1|nr:M28 family metallopeptidase [Streptomyces mobaraensis]EMF01426.1 aminopeptidase [Streptomyces mobaraensis NBRC 13819 = DSM 40847]
MRLPRRPRGPRGRKALAALISTAVAAPVLLSAAPADARTADGPARQHRKAERLARQLERDASAKGAYRHLKALQRIADANGGNRAAGTAGHEASAAYVHRLLKQAGYRVSYQWFDVWQAKTLTEKLSVVSPDARDLQVKAAEFSPSTPKSGLRAALALARVDKDSGCAADDYQGTSFTGRIALVKRGGCTFAEKQKAAAAAGAVGTIIYNNVAGGVAKPSFGSPADGKVPTAGISQADGEALAAAAAKGEVRVALDIQQQHIKRRTPNVIAETRGGDPRHVVALGSHLDSVPEGPGINDNGSGSAGLLEVALKLADRTRRSGQQPTNKVRFAWWSGEELGLLGSEHYVAQLSEAERKKIALYLNFDMIASPNPAQLVYDGDDSDHKGSGPGPKGSAEIEKLINGYLDRKGKPHEGTDFDGRSDYGPFIATGIPAGGTFTGAEGIKSPEQAAKFGGKAGAPYDPNYHAKGDNLSNLDLKAFDTNIDVIAHAVGIYAHDLSSLGGGARG